MKNKLAAAFLAVVLLTAGLSGLQIVSSSASTDNTSSAPSTEEHTNLTTESVPKYDTDNARLASMEEVFDNGKMTLYVDKTFCQFAVHDQKNGKIYFSTPTNISFDPKASKETIEAMLSLLSIEYYSIGGNSFQELNSFKESVETNQVKYENIPNGIQITFTFGRNEASRLLPKAMSAESFDKVVEKLQGRAQSRLKIFYRKYDLTDIPETLKQDIIDKFPAVQNGPIRALQGEITNKEKDELEGYFKSAGYTMSQLNEENKKMNQSVEEDIFPYFVVPLQITLDGSDMLVNVPCEKLIYDKKYFFITKISVLKFFASASNDTDGYIFYPDGSGTIINTQYAETKQAAGISGKVFGDDDSVTPPDFSGFKQNISLPVFGIKYSDKAMLAIIENGAEISELNLKFANNINSYTNTYSTAVIRDRDFYNFIDTAQQVPMYAFSKTIFDGNYTIRYKFITEPEKADYSNMARLYRDYLIKNGTLKKNGVGSKASLYLEMLGSVTARDRQLGVSVEKQVSLTKFSEAESVIDDFTSRGFDTKMIMNGWSNGGLIHSVFTKFEPESVLGGKNGLNSLINFAKEKNTPLYLQCNISYAWKDINLDGFSQFKDTSRTLFDKVAMKPEVNLSSGIYKIGKDSLRVISPRFIQDNFDSFLNGFGSFDSKYLSLSYFGNSLNSDFNTQKEIVRIKSLGINKTIMKKISDKYSFMTEGSNVYSFPYASDLTKISDNSSEYSDTDYSVPFLQMVLHGSISYSSPALNLTSDYQTSLLRAVENGSGLYYTLAVGNSEQLKNTPLGGYFSVDYSFWKPKIEADFKKVSDILNQVNSAEMTSHKYLEYGFVEIGYDNGKNIYVNYSDGEKSVDGVTVAARSFAIQ